MGCHHKDHINGVATPMLVGNCQVKCVNVKNGHSWMIRWKCHPHPKAQTLL